MAPSVPGLPWFGAVLVALVLTVVGAIVGGSSFSDGIPMSLWVCYLGGTVIAVLAVRRQAVFTAMVQPPLIAAVVVFLAAKLFDGQETLFAGLNVVKSFPMMAVGTGIAVVLGLARIAAQPLRTRQPRSSVEPRPEAPAAV